jgi:hypothetical protein
MRRQPRLDLEPVHQPAPQIAENRGVGRRRQTGVAAQALEQRVETLAEVPRAEVREPGPLDRLREQHVTGRITALQRVPHLPTLCPGRG